MHSLSYSTVLSFHIGGRKNRSNNIICTTGVNEGTIATELKKKEEERQQKGQNPFVNHCRQVYE